MSQFRLGFRVHAIQRMFQLGLGEKRLRKVVAAGDTQETYPEDKPFPSRLMLGWGGSRPVHVVVADNVAAQGSHHHHRLPTGSGEVGSPALRGRR